MSAFRIGQCWTDRAGNVRAHIVAITDHPNLPLVVQTECGNVWAHRADGTWPFPNNARFDLVTLISEPRDPVSDTEDADHPEMVIA